MKTTHLLPVLAVTPALLVCACTAATSGDTGDPGAGGSGGSFASAMSAGAPSDIGPGGSGAGGIAGGRGSSGAGEISGASGSSDAGGSSGASGIAVDGGSTDAGSAHDAGAAGSAHARPSGPVNAPADMAFEAYNNAFLVKSDGKTYYKKSIDDGTADGTWVASLDILVAEDAYERTGVVAQKTLVDDLCTTWLKNTPMPWTWDGWNDDIGWFSLALIRGYQMTGTASFLDAAKYGFDMAWARGWDTQYNGGGIWEQQPDKTPAGQPIGKEALSNDSLGKVACLIYQATLDQSYLNRAIQIYDWVWNHIYNSADGQVDTGIDRSNAVDTGSAVYNQGTFVDFANMLYEITGDMKYFDDAKRSIDYVKSKMTTNGVISNSAGYLNTWADEFARGLGHFARDNGQWDAYFPWMIQNATAIWNSRRTDRDITWNGWAQQTPNDDTLTTSKFASAVAWMQFTPVARPDVVGGIHLVVNEQSGAAIDNAGQTTDGAGIVQWELSNSKNQKWLFTQNDDTSWNLVSLSSWKALDIPANSATGAQVVQEVAGRGDSQRWWVDLLADGSYEISNKATGDALGTSSSNGCDGSSQNGCAFVVAKWQGGNSQHWSLQ